MSWLANPLPGLGVPQRSGYWREANNSIGQLTRRRTSRSGLSGLMVRRAISASRFARLTLYAGFDCHPNILVCLVGRAIADITKSKAKESVEAIRTSPAGRVSRPSMRRFNSLPASSIFPAASNAASPAVARAYPSELRKNGVVFNARAFQKP